MVLGIDGTTWLGPDGEIETLDHATAIARLQDERAIVCHGRSISRRLGIDRLVAYDVLELFAFVRPATFCVPTPRGLAAALALDTPQTASEEAFALFRSVDALLSELANPDRDDRSDAVGISWIMGQGNWPWAPAVLNSLGKPEGPDGRALRRAMDIWTRLPEPSDHAPEPPPGQHGVDDTEARTRLADLVHAAVPGKNVEPRPQQSDYASAVCHAFTPRDQADAPNSVLAEAGTGVGKTLGYLAPATVWSEKNGGAVWISTYTRALQHQIDGELDRLYPDPLVKARRVVLRKGRENYLCLLNLEDATRLLPTNPHFATAIGLMARWAAVTRDGDLGGGDFPGWLADIAGRGRTLGLADRRGECIYSACNHYSKCFIERSVRRARRADVVVANHALVMIQVALGGMDDTHLPTRYVFDEGHHIFAAADSAFAAHLSGQETAELRRWLLGAETSRRGRARGLRRRVEDLLGDSTEAWSHLDGLEAAARALPGDGWHGRIGSDDPRGPTERFLCLVRRQVYARAEGQDGPYSLEVDSKPLIDGLEDATQGLEAALLTLLKPLEGLASCLEDRLDDDADDLDSDTRRRVDATARGLRRRSLHTLAAWRGMLEALRNDTPAAFVDWMAVERQDGRDLDVGLYRHWVDPTIPFAASIGTQAHGLVITSATLTDGTGDTEQDWQAAEDRTGSIHLARPSLRASVPSPFPYAERTRVLVVKDVRKDDMRQVASAYRTLFLAAGGGALGLFTAISRLRAVHRNIASDLSASGIHLLGQHVDGLDVGTLIDIFRAEENACLLGTDAVRDGIDVPGRALRLIVFDRVPWPRPDILHKARREAFGTKRYVEMMTRLRLKQAYGRLIRRADDQGVFILLDPMMPSRLGGAFPEGVEIERLGLADAVGIVRTFLHTDTNKAPDAPETG